MNRAVVALSSAESLELALFVTLAVLVVGAAWSIVIAQNIVRTAFSLLLCLAGVAGLYFLLEAEFLAAVQLIVYVGGTLMLMIFGIMLTHRQPFQNLRARSWETVAAVTAGVALAVSLVLASAASPMPTSPPPEPPADSVRRMAAQLLTRHVFAFEFAAVLLLVTMVAAAYLARPGAAAEKDAESEDDAEAEAAEAGPRGSTPGRREEDGERS